MLYGTMAPGWQTSAAQPLPTTSFPAPAWGIAPTGGAFLPTGAPWPGTAAYPTGTPWPGTSPVAGFASPQGIDPFWTAGGFIPTDAELFEIDDDDDGWAGIFPRRRRTRRLRRFPFAHRARFVKPLVTPFTKPVAGPGKGKFGKTGKFGKPFAKGGKGYY